MIKKLLHRVIRRIAVIKEPVLFVHVADLLYRQRLGLTAIQFSVISRYLDTCLWRQGKEPIWHIKLSADDKFVTDNKDNFIKSYVNFLNRMERIGYNPSLSNFSVLQNPYWGLHDGTHRMGYLLSICPNSYVPIRISRPLFRQFFMEDGHKHLQKISLSDEDIKILEAAYAELMNKVYHTFTAYFTQEMFEMKKRKIIENFSKIGRIVDVEINAINKRNGEKICVIRFQPEHQETYYNNGKLQSHIIDRLRKIMTNTVGRKGGYIAASVTESIYVEETIVGETMANYHAN